MRLRQRRPLYAYTVGMHNGTKINESTHNCCKLDRLPKTPDSSIVIALLLRSLQKENCEWTRKKLSQHQQFQTLARSWWGLIKGTSISPLSLPPTAVPQPHPQTTPQPHWPKRPQPSSKPPQEQNTTHQHPICHTLPHTLPTHKLIPIPSPSTPALRQPKPPSHP